MFGLFVYWKNQIAWCRFGVNIENFFTITTCGFCFFFFSSNRKTPLILCESLRYAAEFGDLWVAFSAHHRWGSRARSCLPSITTAVGDDAEALRSVSWPTLGLWMGQLRKRGGMLTTGQEWSLAWLGTSKASRRGLWRSLVMSSKTGPLARPTHLRSSLRFLIWVFSLQNRAFNSWFQKKIIFFMLIMLCCHDCLEFCYVILLWWIFWLLMLEEWV